MSTKQCISCYSILALNLFPVRSKAKNLYQNKCKKCTKEIAISRGYTCSKESQKINRHKRQESGKCSYCSSLKMEDKKVCEKHYIAQVVDAATGRSDNNTINYFREKFHSNPYCPYTGEKLILGVNAHLDHIKSKKNCPELSKEFSNLEWISEMANLSKNSFNKEEFISFCKSVAARF